MIQRSQQVRLFYAALIVANLIKHLLILFAGLEQPWSDSLGYWRLGSEVAGGDLCLLDEPIGFRTLGYPWYLAIHQWLGGDAALWSAVVIQHIMSILTDLLIVRWIYEVTRSHGCALVAFVFLTWCTARAWYANWILTETLAGALVVLTIYLTWHAWQRPSIGRMLALMVLIGIGIQIRPSLLVLLPLGFVPATWKLFGKSRWSNWWRSPDDGMQSVATVDRYQKNNARLFFATLLGYGLMAVILLPCCYRNYVLFGQPRLVIFQGRELWIATFGDWPGAGLEVPTTGAGGQVRALLTNGEGVDWRENWSVGPALAARGLNDAEVDNLMEAAAWQAIKASPGRAAYCIVARMSTFWYCWAWPPEKSEFAPPVEFTKQWGYEGFASARAIASLSYALSPEFIPVISWAWMLGGGVGLVMMLKSKTGRQIGIVIAYVFIATTVTTAFFEIPNYRYRLPIEPLTVFVMCVGFWKAVR